ncbi:hypothetical protein Fmac_021100 [Flemingia macrophylla]|uniref:Uncharacterized protein n=1 Tax=Flemingia macrophylla TaxID=520843 RepID=A0ABD1LVV5_9FABA
MSMDFFVAMDVKNGENEISDSSDILNSIAFRQNEVLSPEDLAWVDSCLVKDSEISESDWIPMQNALLEIFCSQFQSFSTEGEDMEIPPCSISSDCTTVELNQQSSTSDVKRLSEPSSSDGKHLSEPSSAYDVNPLLRMAVETSTDNIVNDEKNGSLPSLNPFLPTYNEELKENEAADLGRYMDSPSYEMEQLAENIFKIWDLDIPSEEGELINQLDKAISENSFQTVASSFDDSVKWKDIKESSLDDLTAAIADLSLNKNV